MTNLPDHSRAVLSNAKTHLSGLGKIQAKGDIKGVQVPGLQGKTQYNHRKDILMSTLSS